MAKCLIGNLVILIPVLTIAETVATNYEKHTAHNNIRTFILYSDFKKNCGKNN
ncbi:exported hypothetical protein [Tenacibaculum halocynthiae]